MSSQVEVGALPRNKKKRGCIAILGVALIVLVAMVLDTSVVPLGAQQEEGFAADRYGAKQFPIVRDNIERRAVDARELTAAISEDKAAAGERYGVSAGIGPVVPVTFTGVVGDGKGGVYSVDVEGIPDDLTIRVQTGPAINGTDLRDATGDIEFGQFTNQIEYQNAGAAINDEMKAQVLAGIDSDALGGETVSVTGVFKLINPNNWLVTPVSLNVQ